MTITPPRTGFLLASVFFLITLALAGILPLWLDEILQLIETRDKSAAMMIASLPIQSGSAPLGYLVQHAMLKATGYSVRRSRLPSVIFGAGAVFVVALLGAELGLKQGWRAAAIFALFPLTLRYATESRIYCQALFLSALATLLYARLAKNPSTGRTIAWWVTLTIAVYTQPYVVFIGLAHILWSLAVRDRKTVLYGAVGFALTILAFLPWYLWSKAGWAAAIANTNLHFSMSAKTPLMIFRELAGAGYWGSGLLAILSIIGITVRRLAPRAAGFLAISVAVPIVFGLAADSAFGYFIAMRQFIWVLPAAAILAAGGTDFIRARWAPSIITALLAIVLLWQDVRYFTGPHEDWQQAADTLAAEVNGGACLAVAPPGQAVFYRFFQPQLEERGCDRPRTVLAITPYSTNEQRQAAIAGIIARGFTEKTETSVGKSGILIFVRRT